MTAGVGHLGQIRAIGFGMRFGFMHDSAVVQFVAGDARDAELESAVLGRAPQLVRNWHRLP